jgi:hypothetical protein
MSDLREAERETEVGVNSPTTVTDACSFRQIEQVYYLLHGTNNKGEPCLFRKNL